jgi:small ligand-binding sensory domain FIST
MPNQAASELITGPPSEERLSEAARNCRERLRGEVSAGFFFFSPEYAADLQEHLEVVRLHGHIPVLNGCLASGGITSGVEEESNPVATLLLLSTPETEFSTFHIPEAVISEQLTATDLRDAAGPRAMEADGVVIFGNPALVASQKFFPAWNSAFRNLPCAGALASGGSTPEECVMVRDGEVLEGGVVGLAFRGGMKMITVTSQGCRPIGAPLTITKAENNLVYQMGGSTAYEVLDEVFQRLTDKEKANARGNLFAGLASSEYLEDFKRGDFLIRNIIGADPNSGAVVIGSPARVGQTMQYQMRDFSTAHQDLVEVFRTMAAEIHPPFGALLFSCLGRGQNFFKSPNHDAELLAKNFGDPPVAGFFSNGEIGPVGEKIFLHSYSAVSALFV